MRASIKILAAVIFICLFFLTEDLGANIFDAFADPRDGSFDASNWLIERKGFLPVPLIITEPAVGYGIGAEIEPRWDITDRWSLVGFIGAGWTADSLNNLFDSSGKVAGGAGFRYLIARRLGIRAGVDVARGPEDTAIYLTVGSGWR